MARVFGSDDHIVECDCVVDVSVGLRCCLSTEHNQSLVDDATT